MLVWILALINDLNLRKAQNWSTCLLNAIQTKIGREYCTKQLPHWNHAEVPYVRPLRHIHENADTITSSDVGIYDRIVIQEILKEIAQTQQVDLNAKQRFKGE